MVISKVHISTNNDVLMRLGFGRLRSVGWL